MSQSNRERFAAFSFVDRITEIDGLRRVAGHYTIPAHASSFPVSLVAEAIGQLAAWVAMSNVGFRRRPVAALAGATRVLMTPQPGQTLDLEVDIESCDEDAIVYRGKASVAGQTVLTLDDTLGSMLDIEEFDDPQRLADDFRTLVGKGCEPGRFLGVDLAALQISSHETAQAIEALLQVPAKADYFEDHFPRRPVFPATLLLDALMRLAAILVADVTAVPVRIDRISHVKVRAFTAPGATLTLFAQTPQALDDEPGVWMLKAGARNEEGRVIAGARIYFK